MGGDSNVADVNALLQAAEEQDVFSTMSLDAIKAGDLGAQIGAGLGATPDSLKAAEAILVASIIDNSSSIDGIPNGPESVCAGQRLYLDAFGGSKQEAGILIGTWLVNQDDPVHPFVIIDGAVRLENGQNYRANGMTPLYRRTCAVLATLGVKMQIEYLEAGCACRGILLIVTDGRDEDYSGSGKGVTADHCKAMIEDLGEILIVQFMGIKGNDNVNYEQIALEMGIQPQHIITPDADEHSIRAAFEFASKSAVSASKSADSFSKQAMQGFTA